MFFFRCLTTLVFFVLQSSLLVGVAAEIVARKGLYPNLERSSLEIPDLEPVTITEGDSSWGHKKLHSYLDHYTTVSPANVYTLPTLDYEDKDDQFSTSALKQFLDNYAEKIRKEKFHNVTKKNNVQSTADIQEGKGNKKRYNLKKPEKQKDPFDEKEGWVSLEPVPWSLSQVSRWKNKPPQPTDHAYTSQENDVPWENYSDYPILASTPQNYYKYPNSLTTSDYPAFPEEINIFNRFKNRFKKPAVKKPTTELTLADSLSLNFMPQKQSLIINKDHGIITDNVSPNFPKHAVDLTRRQGTEMYPEDHPFTGNGNWVLLSTSKGYKYPKKQRALKITPQINDHISVQLTVLPPHKDSNINMTTSHGGLLQVESSFEPVEETQQKLQRLQKLQKLQNQQQKLQKVHKQKVKRKRPANLRKKNKKKVEVLRTISQPVARSTNSDSSAVLAGVGAGLIPATMAMFVPMVMNGRKRKKRDVISF
ncbi:uncharacterized protein [Diabrotica undecimpunctata]|uniref:uncharacterized protein n=1 Tax=Diabrotica undecimpunctata TaxID=50387 RepID=UPI003B637078